VPNVRGDVFWTSLCIPPTPGTGLIHSPFFLRPACLIILERKYANNISQHTHWGRQQSAGPPPPPPRPPARPGPSVHSRQLLRPDPGGPPVHSPPHRRHTGAGGEGQRQWKDYQNAFWTNNFATQKKVSLRRTTSLCLDREPTASRSRTHTHTHTHTPAPICLAHVSLPLPPARMHRKLHPTNAHSPFRTPFQKAEGHT
jgi:hypothetical protein